MMEGLKKGGLKGWSRFALALVVGVGLATPAFANQELHPGGRLFYPLWDISGGRVTFVTITRLPQFVSETSSDDGTPGQVGSSSFYSAFNNCRPGHTSASGFPGTGPAGFVDDVHLEWYGKTCTGHDDTIQMSCGDVDLIFLSQATRGAILTGGITDDQGALDVHFIVNGTSPDNKGRFLENSLMGQATIVDTTEGWAASYPAAAAKATFCSLCREFDGNSGPSTDVGYEPFPLELFLPHVLTDESQGGIQNLISLWAPSFFPGQSLLNTSTNLGWCWYDGRERKFCSSRDNHVLVDFLDNLDGKFTVGNFICGHASATVAENDSPRADIVGGNAELCGGFVADTVHTSDNLNSDIQSSTPIGWWNFHRLDSSGDETFAGTTIRRVRGLVGVVLTSVSSLGETKRLWHKDPCEKGPFEHFGPPHIRDRFVTNNNMVFFNSDYFSDQDRQNLCDGIIPTIGPPARDLNVVPPLLP